MSPINNYFKNVLQNNSAGTNFTAGQLNRAVGQQNNRSFDNDGFSIPPIPSSDRAGLPSNKIPYGLPATNKRHIMHFFVPQVGVVNLYVNPQSIQYNFSKLIESARTKGGYTVQYWGEELSTLVIQGTTGSSGVEGLNVLQEVYRAEQLTFDSIGLTVASNNSVSGISNLITNTLGDGIGNLTGGLIGLNPLTQSILPRNIPTLATLAFGIEIYYAGWVFRGYFKSFNFTESADRLGLFDYTINFMVTQRRGYRTNYMPWHHSATTGPSNWDNVPLTFDGRLTNR